MNEVLLTLENVSCLYGERIILQGVSFGIHSSEKIGIVGINGSGKTLRVIRISRKLRLFFSVITRLVYTLVSEDELKHNQVD